MKKFILLLFLSYASTIFAQTAKKEILLDENGKQITAVEFKKNVTPPGNKYTYTKYENDTVVYGRLVPFRSYGVLDEQVKAKIINELTQLTGNEVDKSKTIIINYYYIEPVKNQRPCIDHYTSDKAYKRFIKKNEDIAQFFITTQGYRYKKDDVFEDKNYVIGKAVFPDEIYCGNYIIIKPNGQYYKQVGEYRQDHIPKIVKAEW